VSRLRKVGRRPTFENFLENFENFLKISLIFSGTKKIKIDKKSKNEGASSDFFGIVSRQVEK